MILKEQISTQLYLYIIVKANPFKITVENETLLIR